MKNGIIIRNAKKEDVRQIAEICVEDWKKAYRGIFDSDFLNSRSVDKQYEKEIRYDTGRSAPQVSTWPIYYWGRVVK